MNKLLSGLLLMFAVLLASCGGVKYNVSGTSSLPELDGKKLYLRVVDANNDNELVSIDSCEVVHGQFSFSGTVDSVKMAMLYMDDTSIMPLVLEGGNVKIVLNDREQSVGGTPLNDKFYVYIDKRRQIENDALELPRRQNQMILDGVDETEMNMILSSEQARLEKQVDSLDTHFVKENFDNVLSVGVFMSIVSQFKYPVLTPQLEDILSSAPESFKENKLIKKYVEEAEEFKKQIQYIPGSSSDEPVEKKK
ncbi:MAG: DUF4369 domain-containing protein [Bacteroidaceae bacterium]|nr:DUF4369 domain-containing protein [Bacteroidaceae bacterium]